MGDISWGQIVFNGLMNSSVYIMIALGLALIFSIMDIVNFAHGEIYMVGAYFMYYIGGLHIPYLLTPILVVLILYGVGYFLERFLFSKVQSSPMGGMVISIGLILIFEQGALLVFGPDFKQLLSPLQGSLNLFIGVIPWERSLTIIGAVILIVILQWILRKTWMGLALRSAGQDREVAILNGIDIPRTCRFGFGIGCALAGAAGALVTPVFFISPNMGWAPLLRAFACIMIGGLGSIPGAIFGGLILGFLESLLAIFVKSAIAPLFTFLFIIVILVFLPRGIMGYESPEIR